VSEFAHDPSVAEGNLGRLTECFGEAGASGRPGEVCPFVESSKSRLASSLKISAEPCSGDLVAKCTGRSDIFFAGWKEDASGEGGHISVVQYICEVDVHDLQGANFGTGFRDHAA
jgi:hypothetical protein